MGKADQLISQYKFIARLLVAGYVHSEVNKHCACVLCFFTRSVGQLLGEVSTQTYVDGVNAKMDPLA